jgi:hypothetical protein
MSTSISVSSFSFSLSYATLGFNTQSANLPAAQGAASSNNASPSDNTSIVPMENYRDHGGHEHRQGVLYQAISLSFSQIGISLSSDASTQSTAVDTSVTGDSAATSSNLNMNTPASKALHEFMHTLLEAMHEIGSAIGNNSGTGEDVRESARHHGYVGFGNRIQSLLQTVSGVTSTTSSAPASVVDTAGGSSSTNALNQLQTSFGNVVQANPHTGTPTLKDFLEAMMNNLDGMRNQGASGVSATVFNFSFSGTLVNVQA